MSLGNYDGKQMVEDYKNMIKVEKKLIKKYTFRSVITLFGQTIITGAIFFSVAATAILVFTIPAKAVVNAVQFLWNIL